MPNTLERAERDILRTLQTEGRLSNVELARAIGLSESPTLRRVRALEERGVIQGYTARVEQRALGLQVTAFVQVRLQKEDDATTSAFLDRVLDEAHIVECHAMSGGYDYLLKVVAQSMDHFSQLIMRGILRFPGVKDIESSFSLETVKAGAALPVPTG